MNKFKIRINQKPIILALSILAIFLIALVLVDIFRVPAEKDNSLNPGDLVEVYEPMKIEELAAESAEEKDKFRQEVPAGVVVVDRDTVLTEAEKLEIAVPLIVSPASPGSSDSQRIFNIRAENDSYVPKTITAYVNDVVSVQFTAVDKDYDLIFSSNNMIVRAKKGETKSLQFNAYESGNFAIYCSTCGGPEKGPTGNFIIVPR